jgi:uncharacterized membrane protein SpoIIM required for sporulation
LKESDFIAQNKKKWVDFEKEWSARNFRPDKVSRFYIDTVDDLSYARTHYPNRLVRQYLNGITQLLSLQIYKSQKGYHNGFVQFWKTDLPLVMYSARKEFFLSFLIFAIAVAIGVFSAMNDEGFTRYILGEAYVNQTLGNMEKGDPMAIYKDEAQTAMFLSITYNNIMVSVRTYLLSLFFGFGTLSVLIYNGIMLGAFQYLFVEEGFFFESFLTVWQHGTVEISCIILAGTAGLTLAKGVLFPGTYGRLDAFRQAGRKSLIIMLGLIPLLVYSGAVEGFVTRYTEMHWLIRLSTILLSLGFVLVYFVWYPKKQALTASSKAQKNLYLHPIEMSTFSFTAIERPAAILWKTLQLIFINRSKLLWVLSSLAVFIVALTYFTENAMTSDLNQPSSLFFWHFFHTKTYTLLFLYNFLFLFVTAIYGVKLVMGSAAKESHYAVRKKGQSLRLVAFALLTALVGSAALINAWVALLLAFILPFLVFFVQKRAFNNSSNSKSLFDTFDLLGQGLGRVVGVFFVNAFIWLLVMLFIQSTISNMLPMAIGYVLVSKAHFSMILFICSTFLLVFPLLLFYLMLFISTSLCYFSCAEMNTAYSIKQNVSRLFPSSADAEGEATSLLTSSKLR